MSDELYTRCADLLGELGLLEGPGLAEERKILSVEPLTGGVASDIALVRLTDMSVAVKFALPKLKVAADWFVPVRRNAAEYAWLQVAANIRPNDAIQLYGRVDALGGFAMAFLEPDTAYTWKAELLAQAPDRFEASKVGATIGQIQAASTRPGFDASAFQNRDDFHAIRIEPYILHTALANADLAVELNTLADQTYANNSVLIHGDLSPKNIMVRDGAPILLDAECATMGDPAFDPSFCINHLVIKALHLPDCRQRYLANVMDLWNAYKQHISWEDPAKLEARVCRLVPALMLGRVDGKSPIEYLDTANLQVLRAISRQKIKATEQSLSALVDDLNQQMDKAKA